MRIEFADSLKIRQTYLYFLLIYPPTKSNSNVHGRLPIGTSGSSLMSGSGGIGGSARLLAAKSVNRPSVMLTDASSEDVDEN